jgi:hypothetical protein
VELALTRLSCGDYQRRHRFEKITISTRLDVAKADSAETKSGILLHKGPDKLLAGRIECCRIFDLIKITR